MQKHRWKIERETQINRKSAALRHQSKLSLKITLIGSNLRLNNWQLIYENF